MFTTFPSRFSSDNSLEIPDISTLFLLLSVIFRELFELVY